MKKYRKLNKWIDELCKDKKYEFIEKVFNVEKNLLKSKTKIEDKITISSLILYQTKEIWIIPKTKSLSHEEISSENSGFMQQDSTNLEEEQESDFKTNINPNLRDSPELDNQTPITKSLTTKPQTSFCSALNELETLLNESPGLLFPEDPTQSLPSLIDPLLPSIPEEPLEDPPSPSTPNKSMNDDDASTSKN